MFTLFKYLVWLVVSLMFLMLATISISEFLVESAIDAPYDEKLTDTVRVLASDLRAEGASLSIRPGAMQLLRSQEDRYPLLLELREVPDMGPPFDTLRQVFDTLEGLKPHDE